MSMIVKLLLDALALFLGARFLKGVEIDGFIRAIWVALVIAVLNLTVGTFVKVVTLGLFSIGLFNLVLNAGLIMIADYFVKGMKVKNFWWALGLALFVAVVNTVTYKLFL